MSDRSLRMARLLGEMHRQMNGAVVGSMRLYGEEYGLNYGVSISTIRAIATEELRGGGVDHSFAKLLYQQGVRELRLASFWFVDIDSLEGDYDFWARGVVNSEVAEELAFALLSRSEGAKGWLWREGELLQYCALMALAKRGVTSLDGDLLQRVAELLLGEVHILQNGVVALLDTAIRAGVSVEAINRFVEAMPESRATNFIKEEIKWRVEFAI